MLGSLLVVGGVVLARYLILVASLFGARDVTRWAGGLLPIERKLIRWWAWRGLDEEGKRHALWMRERMKRGLPPY